MVSIPEKTLKRKAEEISSDSEEVAMEKDTETSTAADNSTLGLCDDILLGEVITQFPWYNRPVVMAFSEWWFHAMTHSFPYYARLHHRRCLSKSLVLFHTPSLEFPAYNSLALWVYSADIDRALFTLPLPVIPKELRVNVTFVRDDNDERIYSFTPDDVNGQKMYHVSVYDLREGSVRWKKLPPLPILEEQSVLRCFSFDNGGCYTTYHIVWVPNGIDGGPINDFTVWTFSGRNDITEWQSQWQPQLHFCPALIEKFLGFYPEVQEPPIYVEFITGSISGDQPLKCLYELCDHTDFSTEYYNFFRFPDNFLMQFQVDEYENERTTTRTTGYTLYYMSVAESNGCELSFHKIKLSEENCTAIEGFWEYWNEWIPDLEHRTETKAKRFTTKIFQEWERETFRLDGAVDIDAIKLAPKGALHVYRFLATNFVE